MPLAYQIDEDRGVVSTRGEGAVTAGDFLGHLEALAADPAFRPEFDELIDLTAVTSTEIEGKHVREIVLAREQSGTEGPGSRLAVVADRHVLFGLARMAEMLAARTTDRVRVFRTREEAELWLAAIRSGDPDG